MVIEIVILAMIAAFLGLRLYSVLGSRAEQGEEPVPTRFDQGDQPIGAARAPLPGQTPGAGAPTREVFGLPAAVEQGLRQIAAVDRRFDLSSFLEGAKGAYRMILEAFWRGDRDDLRALCAPDVYREFDAAITARDAAGETLDNRLVRIEQAKIDSAALEAGTARIAVHFVSDIAAVTRNSAGEVVAGSLDDAVESHDVWTFARNVDADGPDWVLEETDAA